MGIPLFVGNWAMLKLNFCELFPVKVIILYQDTRSHQLSILSWRGPIVGLMHASSQKHGSKLVKPESLPIGQASMVIAHPGIHPRLSPIPHSIPDTSRVLYWHLIRKNHLLNFLAFYLHFCLKPVILNLGCTLWLLLDTKNKIKHTHTHTESKQIHFYLCSAWKINQKLGVGPEY